MGRFILAIFLGIPFCAAFAQVPAGQILFSSGLPGNSTCGLYIINGDGTGERQLTHSGRRIDFSNAQDGQIAYMQMTEDKQGYDLLLCNKDGETVRTLIAHEGLCKPQWQPHGKLIAYEYYPENRMEIWVMNADGTNKHKLIPNARHPYWYADGKKILFTREWQVLSYDIKTRKETTLTFWPGKDYAAKWPTISPDGKMLVYVAFSGDAMMTAMGVVVLDLKTGEGKLMDALGSPYWTTDNNYIVCTYREKKTDDPQIVLVNVTTGQKTYVTNNGRWNDFPAWVR